MVLCRVIPPLRFLLCDLFWIVVILLRRPTSPWFGLSLPFSSVCSSSWPCIASVMNTVWVYLYCKVSLSWCCIGCLLGFVSCNFCFGAHVFQLVAVLEHHANVCNISVFWYGRYAHVYFYGCLSIMYSRCCQIVCFFVLHLDIWLTFLLIVCVHHLHDLGSMRNKDDFASYPVPNCLDGSLCVLFSTLDLRKVYLSHMPLTEHLLYAWCGPLAVLCKWTLCLWSCTWLPMSLPTLPCGSNVPVPSLHTTNLRGLLRPNRPPVPLICIVSALLVYILQSVQICNLVFLSSYVQDYVCGPVPLSSEPCLTMSP